MVLVYADWCPKCRALAPVLARDDVHDLARQLVVVRQNQDEAPPWLEALADEQGNYVPRIIFLDAEGAPLRKLTSGHPRYPFFYASDRPDALVASLKRALAI
jgi:thiol-disulfide isomerase/thioredoxin